MARAVRYIFFGLVAVVLQTAVVPGIAILGVRPDLVVLFAAIVGALEGAPAGTLAGFLVGFMVDIYQPATLGAGTIAGTLAGHVGARVQRLLDLDLPLNQAAGLAFAHVVGVTAYAVVVALKGQGVFWHMLLTQVPGGAVYTAVVGVGVFGVLRLLRGGRHVVERR
jgi:rod shape-determining protein MreD